MSNLLGFNRFLLLWIKTPQKETLINFQKYILHSWQRKAGFCVRPLSHSYTKVIIRLFSIFLESLTKYFFYYSKELKGFYPHIWFSVEHWKIIRLCVQLFHFNSEFDKKIMNEVLIMCGLNIILINWIQVAFTPYGNKKYLLKGCVHYIFASLFCMSKREHFFISFQMLFLFLR